MNYKYYILYNIINNEYNNCCIVLTARTAALSFFQNPALDRESNPHLIFQPSETVKKGAEQIREYTVSSKAGELWNQMKIAALNYQQFYISVLGVIRISRNNLVCFVIAIESSVQFIQSTNSQYLFLNNQPDALIIQIYSIIKLYMFRASSLPIVSFLLYLRCSIPKCL